MDKNRRYTCPSCGFLSYTEPAGGSYEICTICRWEDDPVQLKYPEMRGGANKESFYECQSHILKEIPEKVKEYKGYKRDPKWRPLEKAEIIRPKKQEYGNVDYFHDSAENPPKMYWLKNKEE